ncbi:Glutathione S-transferase GstB [Legionella busanensis]|uniref:Glutathione S-transferase GstB n=1 Tax=Legionella busanensis TaxID=190655 RepID=A0A378JMB6_9GAMM|nr:glutathione S-transferase family protein [Legionella busanensis]STX52496.1 Glutathione S-transferase GstB [Legionella busanensis]
MTNQRIVFGSIVSPFVRKVWISLRLKHLDFEIKEMAPFFEAHKEALLKLNPLGKIPIYQEDNFTLADSSVICAYLEKKYPAPALYPSKPKDYAQCLWYEEYADTVLIPTVNTIFFNKVLARKFNRTPDEAAIKIASEENLPEIFNYLEQQINNKQYLIGSALSLADISIVVAFLNLELAGISIDKTRWEALSIYVGQTAQEPVISEAFTQARERLTKK